MNTELFRLFSNRKRELEEAGDYETARVTHLKLVEMRCADLKKREEHLLLRQAQEVADLRELQYKDKAVFLKEWKSSRWDFFPPHGGAHGVSSPWWGPWGGRCPRPYARSVFARFPWGHVLTHDGSHFPSP